MQPATERPLARASTAGVSKPLVAALFVAALTLRPQLVGAGPLLPQIQADLRLSHALAGLLATIPVACMGVFALIAPMIARWSGTTASIAGSVALIGVAGLARAAAADSAELLVTTIGIGMGMGVAGALLPVFVKERLGERPILGTVAYSSGLQFGSAASAAIAVPLALGLSGWRSVFAVFSIGTLVIVIPWLMVARDRVVVGRPQIAVGSSDFLDRRSWTLAIVFALFAVAYYGLVTWLPDAYQEHGWSSTDAGGLLGLLNFAALAGALSVGVIPARVASRPSILSLLAILFATATAGFVVAPAAGPVLAILVGFANGALFPVVLAMPLRLAPSSREVARMTAVMLGLGYSVAAAGPAALGAARDALGSFQATLVLVAISAGAFAVGAIVVSRWPTED
jgi:CP family cyanate transporter-like MFS transporter